MNLIVAASSTPVNNDRRSLSVEESSLNTIDIYLMRTSYNSGSTIEYLALKYNLPQNSIVDVINGTIFSDKPGCIQDVV
jgi:Mor family transcriptional regulator